MKNFLQFFRGSTKDKPVMQPAPQTQQEPKPSGYLPRLHRLRNRKPPFAIQDRDIEMLHAISIDRALTASLLKTIFPPDKAKTPPHVFTAAPKRGGTNLDRRLNGLFHYGYVARIRTEFSGQLYYLLTPKGVQLLEEKQLPIPLELTTVEKARKPKRYYLEHAEMVARFHTALLLGTREHPSVQLLHYEREGKDLKAEWRRAEKRIYVNPDAFFILQDTTQPDGRQRTAYFLEADRSTMHLPDLLEKYVRYSQMYAARIHQEAFGIPNFRVLTVTKSKERASNILKLAAADASPIPKDYRNFFYFTTEERYKEAMQNIFADIWRRTDEPAQLCSIIRSNPLPRQ